MSLNGDDNLQPLNARLALKFQEISKEKEAMVGLTQRAQVEGWSMTQLIEARQPYQARISEIEQTIKELMSQLAERGH